MKIIALRDYYWNVKNSIEEFKSGISYDVPAKLANAMISIRFAEKKAKKKVVLENKMIEIEYK